MDTGEPLGIFCWTFFLGRSFSNAPFDIYGLDFRMVAGYVRLFKDEGSRKLYKMQIFPLLVKEKAICEDPSLYFLSFLIW